MEYQRDITKQKLGDRLVAASQQDNGQDVDTVLMDLEDMDPTPNKQYVMWLIRQYIQGQFKLEKKAKVKDTLEKFIKAKSRLPEKDIGKYTFLSLDDAMDKVYNVELTPQKAASDEEHTTTFDLPKGINAEVLYNGPLGLLTVPKDHKASCALGVKNWCTAVPGSPSTFKEYSRRAPLYIWRDKNGDKYQFHFGLAEYGAPPEFRDKFDRPIKKEQLMYFAQEHPILKKLFKLGEKQFFEKITGSLRSLPRWERRYLANSITGYLNRVGKKLSDVVHYLVNTPEIFLDFYVKRTPEIEPYIFNSDFLNQMFKKDFSKYHDAPVRKVVEYVARYIKKRIPELEEAILNNMDQPGGDIAAASIYANRVIKGRWPELEPYLVKYSSADSLAWYISRIKQRVSPELEKRIALKASLAFLYATRIRRRFPQGEARIAKDGLYALKYAIEVVKNKWPEGESAILGPSHSRNLYFRDEYNRLLRSKGHPPIGRKAANAKKTAKKKTAKKKTAKKKTAKR